jgi:isoaspartyl peptidase/L-asparaginase-like protein (Ntn-hydrolase superfamily)
MELDAAVMCGTTLQYGAVMAMPGIVRAVSAARAVLQRSPHAILCGEGARDFAASQGVPLQDTLTAAAQSAYEAWLAKRRSVILKCAVIAQLQCYKKL